MDKLYFKHEDIESVVIDKDRNLIIKFKKNDNTKKLKRHLLKQSTDDHI